MKNLDRESDIVTIGGWTGELDVAVGLMDDEIRERLHLAMAPCEAQAFVDAYCEAHRAKFGDEFRVN